MNYYPLLYKKEWDKTVEIFESWWERELRRLIIQIVAPNPDVPKSFDLQSNISTLSWAFLLHAPEAEKALNSIFCIFDKLSFLGEAYPNVFINLGPGVLAAYLGADVKFDIKTRTAWFVGKKRLEELYTIDFNDIRSNYWWKYSLKCIKEANKHCKGKAIISPPDLLDVVTTLALLRGRMPVNFIRDIYRDCSKVKTVLDHMHELWFKCFEEFYREIDIKSYGYSTFANIWSKRKFQILQCDFISYLSPRLFDKIAYPYINEECKYFERCFWHLDGPLELPHLEKLLNIKELDGIQWVPGPGDPNSGSEKWIPLYRKIQSKGKLLQLIEVPGDRVIPTLEKINPKGVLMDVINLTYNQADRLFRKISKKYG